jgi:hypothetical protein
MSSWKLDVEVLERLRCSVLVLFCPSPEPVIRDCSKLLRWLLLALTASHSTPAFCSSAASAAVAGLTPASRSRSSQLFLYKFVSSAATLRRPTGINPSVLLSGLSLLGLTVNIFCCLLLQCFPPKPAAADALSLSLQRRLVDLNSAAQDLRSLLRMHFRRLNLPLRMQSVSLTVRCCK